MREKSRGFHWRPVLAILAVALVSAATAAVAQPPVEVTVSVSGGSAPSASGSATAQVTINNGSVLQGYKWTQTKGRTFASTGPDNQRTFNFTTAAGYLYRKTLIDTLLEPPITEAQLPPNVPAPEGEFVGGLQDRFQVVGINPFALEEAGMAELEVEVMTSSGTYKGHGVVHTALPWKPATGNRNVPIGQPVLLYGKTQDSYDWALADKPSGSMASLEGATGQRPTFLPDDSGTYVVTVTDLDTGMPVSLVVYAGEWRGVIVGEDSNGRPVADTACTGCHSGTIAPDAFTPWAQTGHAEIFSTQINTSTHYSTGCFSCHTVGYDPQVDNGGIDDAPDYQAFLNEDFFHVTGPWIWSTILDDYPDTAQLANIQCENCHGPQKTGAHATTTARQSLSSDICATCHGEPLRHARFQQWQLSAHANYERAIDESQNGSCARCHTGNGFLAWLPVLLGDVPGDIDDDVDVTWTVDETHPQTCATCHDPHSIGTTSGNDANATVRISGDTPELIAGFSVIGAGKAAICMTCHNSRRGLRNDQTWPDATDPDRAPHGSAQTDVLMGENALMVNVGVRGSHSLFESPCVSCHMKATPPPDDLAYNQGGTNHTFYASPDICSECHSEVVTADVLQSVVGEVLHNVEELIGDNYADLMAERIAAGAIIDLNGMATLDSAGDIQSVTFSETRGRQAIIVTTGGAEYGPLRLSDIDVVTGGSRVELADFVPDGLFQAGWNYLLIHNDGSHGVHNPSFTLEVLDASRDALGGVGGPRINLAALLQ